MLLAIDTSAGTSVALVDAAHGIRAERGTPDTMRHAEVIGTLIRDCLLDAGVRSNAVSAVVAGMGPGPFTGLRVGIAAARVFAFARAVPLLPVVSHDAVAFDAYAARPDLGRILVVTDARRRELYWSVFDSSTAAGLPVRVDGPRLSVPGDVVAGIHRLDATSVSAGALGLLALRMREAGAEFAGNDALYLRSPDVTPSRGPKRVTS